MLQNGHRRGELQDGLRCRLGRGRRHPRILPPGLPDFCGLQSPLDPVRTRPPALICFRGLSHDARRGDTFRNCVLCPVCPPHKQKSWLGSQDAYEAHFWAKHATSYKDLLRAAPY